MRRQLLLALCAIAMLGTPIFAQDLDVDLYRTYDGSFNNRSNIQWGAVGDHLRLMVPLSYADGYASPSGADRPNPRELSNEIFFQNRLLNDPLKLSDFCWVWGQFLDHDIGLTPDGTEFLPIEVPQGDRDFDPLGTGQVMIPMMRNAFDPSTGNEFGNPRRHPNLLTAFIDGSNVYGSDQHRADWLRTFEGGKLKVSIGNLLPFNTTTGEYDAPIDEEAPEMDDAVGLSEKHFVAGDVRANENPLLASFHTLFVREHNRLAEEVIVQHPEWNDEQVYQYTRKMVGGFMQAIVYNEYLPAMGVRLDEYQGYDPSINPQLANIFTAAAFRLGHTLLSGDLKRVMNDGTEHPDGAITLRESFFDISFVREDGIDPFLKGMAVQMQQEFDAKVIDDVRNFLFGPPGAGGLDLASININRGRERGLPDYNTIRRSLGLRPYSIFREINLDDIGVTYDLLTNYLNLGKVDPWVGMLAERRLPGALFGETIMEILTRQFTALRDGDRFFYLNDPVLTEEEKQTITNTTFHDVIMRNTTITLMQDEVFNAIPHEEICANMTIDVLGKVHLENGRPVAQVGVDLEAGNSFLTLSTNGLGNFDFRSVPGCDAKRLSLNKEDAHDNGVSTLDLIIVQKHILNRDPLDSPYKVLAADVDNSGSVSTLDLIKMRKVILSIDLYFNEEGAWEFLPADLEFTDESNPFIDALPNIYDLYDVGIDFTQDFVAIKLGDVNNSAETGAETQAASIESRSAAGLFLLLTDEQLVAGEEYTIQVQAKEVAAIAGFQFGLRYQTNAIELLDIEQLSLPNLQRENFALMNDQGLVALSWNNKEDGLDIEANQTLFSFRIKPLQDGQLSDFVYLDNRSIAAEVYNAALETKAIQLQFKQDNQLLPATFQVYQNQPNPFSSETSIPFYLPEDGEIELSIFDVSGKTLLQESRAFAKGSHQWTLQSNDLPGAIGIYYYKMSTKDLTFTKKLIISE